MIAFMEEAVKIVGSWPKWKREVFRGKAKPST